MRQIETSNVEAVHLHLVRQRMVSLAHRVTTYRSSDIGKSNKTSLSIRDLEYQRTLLGTQHGMARVKALALFPQIRPHSHLLFFALDLSVTVVALPSGQCKPQECGHLRHNNASHTARPSAVRGKHTHVYYRSCNLLERLLSPNASVLSHKAGPNFEILMLSHDASTPWASILSLALEQAEDELIATFSRTPFEHHSAWR